MFGKTEVSICLALTALAVRAAAFVPEFRPSENYEETGYNALGYRTTFWNAERNPIHFGVDAQGRITAITNAIGKVTSFTFDDAGNLTDREATVLRGNDKIRIFDHRVCCNSQLSHHSS